MKRHVILYVECLLRRLGLIPRHRAPILNSSIVPYPASCPQGSVARGWWRFMGIVEDAISSLHAFVHILCSPRTGISQQLRPAPQENAIDRQDNLVACCDPHPHPCIFFKKKEKKRDHFLDVCTPRKKKKQNYAIGFRVESVGTAGTAGCVAREVRVCQDIKLFLAFCRQPTAG